MVTPPRLDTTIADQIDCLKGAIVVPPPKGDKNRPVIRSGVLTADGDYVTRAITFRGPGPITIEPAMPDDAAIKTLSGTYMYAGPMFGHFGHFLVESISRLWALTQLEGKIDGIVFSPKFQNNPQKMAENFRPILKVLGVDVPVILVDEPTRIDTLYLPQQGFGMFQMIEGAPEFRAFVQDRCGASIPAQGAEKIYLSRSALPPARGGMLGEKRLEALLKAEGYVIYHPQKHSFDEQVAAYKAARKIISVDGSPLHLLALVGDAGQTVACLARRSGAFDKIFAQQLKAFQGIETTTIDALADQWIPEGSDRPDRLSYGEPDLARVYDALKENGFIAGDTRWSPLDPVLKADLLTELESYHKQIFKAYVSEN
jgi:hypothetical protein